MSKVHRIGLRGGRALVLAALFVASCASPRLDVDEVLASGARDEANARQELPAPAGFDVRAKDARDAALAGAGDAALQVAASRAFFLSCDVRMQSAALERLGALPAPTLDEVLNADAGLSSELRAQVESLSASGIEFAERGLALAPEGSPQRESAMLYRAINTSIRAWSVSKSRALFEGLGTDCKHATAACLASDESFEGAAPLRLRGRFLAKAPWPLGDTDEAVDVLRRATDLAPYTLNWMFLGDALYARGDEDEAFAAWREAVDADPGPGATELGGYHTELARWRLVAGTAN